MRALLTCNGCERTAWVKDAEEAQQLGWRWMGNDTDFCRTCCQLDHKE